MPTDWRVKGKIIGACSCDWGCPCNFDARPTKGFCQGGYVWHFKEGHFGDVKLSGLTLCWVGASPGPIHEGNLTSLPIIDERADSRQRDAIVKLFRGTEGGPWAIFASLTSTWLDPIFANIAVHFDGLKSKAKAGEHFEVELSKILNPVTGEPEELQLRKPTGLTSLWADLGTTKKFRVSAPGLSFDHSGQYGEYCESEYTPAGLK